MSAASNEFLMMRMEEQSGELYVPALPKKEIKEKAIQDAKNIMDSGDVYIDDVLVDATRVSEYLSTLIKELRKEIEPKATREQLKGVEITFKNAPSRLNYSEDS